MTSPARAKSSEGVVDLRDRADGAPGRGRRPAAGDGDGRRDALDPVRVRLVQLLEELACVGEKVSTYRRCPSA